VTVDLLLVDGDAMARGWVRLSVGRALRAPLSSEHDVAAASRGWASAGSGGCPAAAVRARPGV